MKKLLAIILLLFSSQATAISNMYPTTEGTICRVLDPDFMELRYATEMPYCRYNVPSSVKNTIFNKYKIVKEEQEKFVIKHIIPLDINGSNHLYNLWPEPKSLERTYGALELKLFIGVRMNVITPEEAIESIRKHKLNARWIYVAGEILIK